MQPVAERHFSAMGTNGHIVVVGPGGQDHLDRAVSRVHELEQRWSRFIESSEISMLNRSSGRPVTVSQDTIMLVEHGASAWLFTNGVFDPSMAIQIADVGYDQTFAQITNHPTEQSTSAGRNEDRAGAGCGLIEVDHDRRTVTIPEGVGFDPGGFGKGLAADIVARDGIELGAAGILVNLGGDLVARGTPPEGDEWIVTISEPKVSSEVIATARIRDAGLATSTTKKRRWKTSSGEQHHILDSSTGHPATPEAVLATVIAGNAWWAEVTATSLLASTTATSNGEATLRVMADGSLERRGEFERYEI